jgi:uncharacterized protein
MGDDLVKPPHGELIAALRKQLLSEAADAIAALQSRIKELEDAMVILRDNPIAVHFNMLRGNIAKLTDAQVAHIYPAALATARREGMLEAAEMHERAYARCAESGDLDEAAWHQRMAEQLRTAADTPTEGDEDDGA